ncbi:VanZ family protein [Paenarthrobacter sp. NPDC057355]|uniref:VanZ family protein n=1 Tax=Paenarthrobacter sp. NPDC057355 TaxID=3346105 RepID=UPI00362D7175
MAHRAAPPYPGICFSTSRIPEVCPSRASCGGIDRRQRLGLDSNLVKACLKNPLPWRRVLTVYVGVLALVGFWPTPVDKSLHGILEAVLKYLHTHGAPGWFNYHLIETSANVAMFIPFGILIAMALPAKAWWQLASLGLMTSTCMELGQLLFLAARFASLMDVVTNTLGTVIGSSIVRLLTAPYSTEHPRWMCLGSTKGDGGSSQQ